MARTSSFGRANGSRTWVRLGGKEAALRARQKCGVNVILHWLDASTLLYAQFLQDPYICVDLSALSVKDPFTFYSSSEASVKDFYTSFFLQHLLWRISTPYFPSATSVGDPYIFFLPSEPLWMIPTPFPPSAPTWKDLYTLIPSRASSVYPCLFCGCFCCGFKNTINTTYRTIALTQILN